MRLRTTRTAVWTAALVCALLSVTAEGAVKLPHVFGNAMVLQCERPVPVWGWADPQEPVTVAFAGQEKTATAGGDGTWRVDLEPMPASAEARDLVVTARNTITLTGVLVGEVWICSGQSNMEWGLGGATNGRAEAAEADYPLIRLLHVRHVATSQPVDDIAATWRVCSPQTAGGFTAVGFFFGRKLVEELDMPIGLINASWSGSRIEPWIPPAGFAAVPELGELHSLVDTWNPQSPGGKAAFSKAIADVEQWLPEAEAAVAAGRYPPAQPRLPGPGESHQEPLKMYNGTIHPLAPFAVKGAIWYQGESNGSEGDSYFHKLQALIGGWRTVFENPELAFHIVQLANYTGDGNTPEGGKGYARIREAQRKALTIRGTGLAVAIDIGQTRDIHPRNKQDVGLRLALSALARTYKRDVVGSGPLYREHTIEGGKIRIAFDHVGAGLMVGDKRGLTPARELTDGELKRFAIAGEDRKWHWASAVIDGEAVVVSSPDVPAPVAVRYAFDANPLGCNLYNRDGLPASPFRTDAW